jgi:hypothetical protein
VDAKGFEFARNVIAVLGGSEGRRLPFLVLLYGLGCMASRVRVEGD